VPQSLIFIRNKAFRFFYKNLLQPLFFQFDPETVHDRMGFFGEFLGRFSLTRNITSSLFNYSDKKLEQDILGIKFKNPVGLGAGFDKNAQLINILPSVGFGFAEVGSITGEPCEGNPKPRLWRLKKSRGFLVWYGLKNDGCEVISEKLKSKKFEIPIGTNIAKTNSPNTVETDMGIADYIKAFKEFTEIGAYFTINISCPNAYGGLPFTDSGRLDKLLDKIDRIATKKPIFLKLSPDLPKSEIDKIIMVCSRHRVHGFVLTNLTKNRTNRKVLDKVLSAEGGMSGKIVENLSNELISYIFQKTNGKYVIIGLGGVFSAQDAYKKIMLGASLVALISGMIYEGPQVISEINIGLVKLLERDGYSNISQAIGADNKIK